MDGEFKLSEEQEQAISLCATSRVSVLTGGPGVGKTSCLKALVEKIIAKDPSKRIALCAPTGRAAKRMGECIGMEGKTIHRTLGFEGDGFKHHRANLLPVQVVAVDECFDARQQVLTEQGWVMIGKIVNQKLDFKVLARNPHTGMLEPKKIVRWLKHDAPTEGLLEIRVGRSDSLRDARLIRCTSDHKLLTTDGYVRAGQLRVGEMLVVRGALLTQLQQSVLVGSVFGDGSLRPGNARVTSPQMKFMNGSAQLDYLLWKHRIFGGLASKISIAPSGYKNGLPAHSFNLRVTDESTRIGLREMAADGVHGSGSRRWRPTDALLDRIDATALAVWFCDNGSVTKRRRPGENTTATLHTERFSRETNEALALVLRHRFDLDVKVMCAGRGFFMLRFSVEGTRKLNETIRSFVPECMERKCPGANFAPALQHPRDTCSAEIRSVERVESSSRHVYDIEVQDHHNYVAGNVVVSNCSMLDQRLAASLLDAIPPSAQVVFIGDADQLPSVGPGTVFRDIIASGAVPVARLTKVYRQDERSRIALNCQAVNRGEIPSFDDASDTSFLDGPTEEVAGHIERVLKEEAPERGFLPRDVQIIIPQRTGAIGVDRVNEVVQELLNPNSGQDKWTFAALELRLGDKVTQTANDYDLTGTNGVKGVFNGELGIICKFEDGDGPTRPEKMHVDFGDRVVPYEKSQAAGGRLRLSYAATVHRLQGCQADAAIVVCSSTHSYMLSRQLLYTALSRAKKYCWLIGDRKGLSRAVKNVDPHSRRTRLGARIAQTYRERSATA